MRLWKRLASFGKGSGRFAFDGVLGLGLIMDGICQLDSGWKGMEVDTAYGKVWSNDMRPRLFMPKT